MFTSENDLKAYVLENYPPVTDQRINEDHWDLLCTRCKVTRGFQVAKRQVSGNTVQRYNYTDFDQDYYAPVVYLFRCPVCKAFKQWIVFELQLQATEDGKYHSYYFRVTSLPSEGLEDIEELPQNPPSLREAYKQAIRAMDANAHLAAAAMFRRALQVITRDLLGAKPGNLANELNEVVGKTYNGATITTDFAKVAYVIKEAGNQGAHPDGDPDLLDFTADDADDLQQIFMELVSELFVIPVAKEKAKQDFMARRKIIAKP
jgi:hypothetical protein